MQDRRQHLTPMDFAESVAFFLLGAIVSNASMTLILAIWLIPALAYASYQGFDKESSFNAAIWPLIALHGAWKAIAGKVKK